MFLFSLQLVQHIFSCLASKASTCNTKRRKIVMKGDGGTPNENKTPMAFFTIPINMFRGRYSTTVFRIYVHLTYVQVCMALYGFQAKPRIVS
jgi:hypothetical protein